MNSKRCSLSLSFVSVSKVEKVLRNLESSKATAVDRGEYFMKLLITPPWWFFETFSQIYTRHKVNPVKFTNSSPIPDILGKLFPDIYWEILSNFHPCLKTHIIMIGDEKFLCYLRILKDLLDLLKDLLENGSYLITFGTIHLNHSQGWIFYKIPR